MRITQLLIAAFVSLVASLCLFVFIVHKPLTMGIVRDYLERKLDYMAGIEANKIVILAGSNARFSHRCETVEELTGIPCVNMGIAAGISIEYQVWNVKPHLRAGDLVYLPLEYGEYSRKEDEVMAAIEVPLAVAYDHKSALAMGSKRLRNALYYFDLKFLISGIGEMAMNRLGVKRRLSVDTMTVQGDEKEHTLEKGKPYREHINNLVWGAKQLKIPDEHTFSPNSYGVAALAEFFEWANANGVLMVGGLPTIFDDVEVSSELLRNLCDFYVGNGHDFLVLDTKSQYRRSLFYDTGYHLSETGQIAHTKKVTPELTAIMRGAEHTEFCTSL